MSFLLQPWHILLAVLCGLVHQRQQQIIQFQNAQIEALLKQLGKQRPFYVLAVMHLKTKRVHIAGITASLSDLRAFKSTRPSGIPLGLVSGVLCTRLETSPASGSSSEPHYPESLASKTRFGLFGWPL